MSQDGIPLRVALVVLALPCLFTVSQAWALMAQAYDVNGRAWAQTAGGVTGGTTVEMMMPSPPETTAAEEVPPPDPDPRPDPPPEKLARTGGPEHGPFPPMPNGECPRGFPLYQGGACYRS